MSEPLFLDFEASSLSSQSYPISVAWTRPEDRAIEHWLINPYHVEAWTDWDFYAQHRIHGISRRRLREEGRSPAFVARCLNAQLAGRWIYATSFEMDGLWLQRLFAAAGLGQAFRFGAADALLAEALSERTGEGRLSDAFRREWARINSVARQRASAEHDAANDVRWLVELYRLAREGGGELLDPSNQQGNQPK